MSYTFYPRKDDPCPNVRHCPHAGGAAISVLVLRGNDNEEYHRYLNGTIDAQREQISRLVQENQKLESDLAQAKLELKLGRQNKFATSEQKNADAEQVVPTAETPADQTAKKKGAPVGHPGWFRPTPTEFDWEIDVAAPRRCPHCHAQVSLLESIDPVQHLQEDIIENVYRVVSYQHQAARCDACGKQVLQAGEGEILGSRIGPELRSIAAWLRNVIGITYFARSWPAAMVPSMPMKPIGRPTVSDLTSGFMAIQSSFTFNTIRLVPGRSLAISWGMILQARW